MSEKGKIEYDFGEQKRRVVCIVTSGSCHEVISHYKDKCGYPRIKYKGKTTGLSRVSWIAINGEIPEDLFVLHQCDNPACINPKHLFLGTHEDNMRDCTRKGRQGGDKRRGVRNTQARLTDSDIVQIRMWASEIKVPSRAVSSLYGIGDTQAYLILSGQKWKHIPRPVGGKEKGKNGPDASYGDDEG